MPAVPWRFPYLPAGPPFALCLLAAASAVAGTILALLPVREPADLTVWTFAQTHVDTLNSPDANGLSPLDHFHRQTGKTVEILLVEPRAMDLRLLSLRQSNDAPQVPDVIQLEMRSAAKLLGRPTPAIGLAPLDQYIDQTTLRNRLLDSRLQLWQRAGITYGLPLDVHPVMLAYRVDHWKRAGLNPATATTWIEFADLCRRYTEFWRNNGHPERVALEFARNRSDHITLLFQQRNLRLVDDYGNPQLLHPQILETMIFAVELLAGPTKCARPTTEGHGRWAADLVAGDVGVLWMPDWRVASLKSLAPSLAGNVNLLPLPKFHQTDATATPTATWGGTMLGIPSNAANVDESWELARFLAASPEALAARSRETGILPPIPDAWDDLPADDGYFTTSPYLSYAELSGRIASVRATPQTLAAAAYISILMETAVGDVENNQSTAKWQRRLADGLKSAQRDLERRADRDKLSQSAR